MSAAGLSAQTFTTLHSFGATDGGFPAGLIQATNGDLYGTTYYGGANNGGTIFRMTPNGTLTTIYNFCAQPNCADGAYPVASLVQAGNGDLYGTTSGGGNSGCTEYDGCGTLFKVTPSGAFTTLYAFCSQSGCPDGRNPEAGLVQATNGNLYGTTALGGSNGNSAGTVFKITPDGVFTSLYSFCSQRVCADGATPQATLIQALNGLLYGTTQTGGRYGCGAVYQITESGTFADLYSFCAQPSCADGAYSRAGVVQANNGDLYGTTSFGGLNGSGIVFRLSVHGDFTTIYNFCALNGCDYGGSPVSSLIQGTDGNLYGATELGGPKQTGTLFRISPTGTLTTLHYFCLQSGCPDGYEPESALVQYTDGIFYGTASSGGADNYGTVFSLSLGLGPFVETQPASGEVGAQVTILGTDLGSATSVTFDGIPADFKVAANSEIVTSVPAGAKTGLVKVSTGAAVLASNKLFYVIP